MCAVINVAARADALHVVASIQPVHSLVAGVMDGVGEPTLLIQGGASPHTYALKPSEAAALQQADVVFWIGEALETFLAKPLRSLSRRAAIVTLADADGVDLVEAGSGDHAAHDHADGGHDHADGGHDMHIWLDPTNAEAMVRRIVDALSLADPAAAPQFRANGAALQRRLAGLDAALFKALTPLQGRPYIVLHDAYRYLERRYGLTQAGAITVSPERRPSARKLTEIRAALADTRASCVFAEPQFEPALAHTVIEGSDARIGVLDPLGSALPPGPDAYFGLMHNLAAALADCLAPHR
ncbi:MAG: zinc ABC transporter substrate-binding protein [Rhodospirillales bacterium]|nr:zinc ABC transporter substrate-binding protein [Rhodospirillales bacterium]